MYPHYKPFSRIETNIRDRESVLIIFRYLSREVLGSTAAVTSILLLVIASGRLIKYLSDAASGKLDASLVFMVLMYRIPSFLELLLPLGLFLGILLAYGRLYLQSEMIVLRACGVSLQKMVLYALGPAAIVAVLIGLMSLDLGPAGKAQTEKIATQQDSRSQLELLMPGRFQVQDDGKQATYAKSLSEDGQSLNDIFIVQRDSKDRAVVLYANSAHREKIPGQGRFLVLTDGHRYDGVPGQADYKDIAYKDYGVRLPAADAALEITETEAMPTSQLLDMQDNAEAQAQLHWRLSLPVLAFIVALIAVPLSRTNPRQGRYAKLIPAILAYLIYVTLLTAARSAVEDGKVGVWSLWSIHLFFLLLAGNLIFAEGFWSQLLNRVPSLRRQRETKA